MNDAELIIALKRAIAQLRNKEAQLGTLENITHNLNCANLILGHFKRFQKLEIVQRELAKKVIERANQKERIRA